MSNKSRRNEHKNRKGKVSDAEMKLAKMSYYWIFNAVWMVLGIFLLAVGLTSQDAKVELAAAVKVGGFIIALAIGMAIYGARRQFQLKRQADLLRPKEKNADHIKK